MFTGHYSASFAGRAADKRIPLWLLFLAVQWIDALWSIFVLLGIEKVRIVPGITASNALDLYYMPYTHSLLGVLCWSAVAYVVCQMAPSRRGVRTGLILAAAVFSHWILDLIVHRPDLALYDSVGKMGFGLWNYRGAAFALEMGVLFCGAAALYRTAVHKVRVVGFAVFLAALQVFGTFFFPPPPSDHAAAMTALVSYIVLALVAWWVDRGEPRSGSSRIDEAGYVAANFCPNTRVDIKLKEKGRIEFILLSETDLSRPWRRTTRHVFPWAAD